MSGLRLDLSFQSDRKSSIFLLIIIALHLKFNYKVTAFSHNSMDLKGRFSQNSKDLEKGRVDGLAAIHPCSIHIQYNNVN
jgi:hypothetical protein